MIHVIFIKNTNSSAKIKKKKEKTNIIPKKKVSLQKKMRYSVITINYNDKNGLERTIV